MAAGAILLAIGGCGSAIATHSAAAPAVKPSSAPAPVVKAQATPVKVPVRASATARLTAGQAAAMNTWYQGATVVQAASVCGDVYKVYSDDNAVNSGTGSSNLQADITSLQADVATALGNPPPVARDAAIWKAVLNAYGNAVGDATSAGLVAAVREADHAAWGWSPSSGTLLSCLDTNP